MSSLVQVTSLQRPVARAKRTLRGHSIPRYWLTAVSCDVSMYRYKVAASVYCESVCCACVGRVCTSLFGFLPVRAARSAEMYLSRGRAAGRTHCA